MSRRLDLRKSEAQSIAEARTTTYADENARSWQFVYSRKEPVTLRELVRDLRHAYRLDMPERMHVHAFDSGGAPEYAGEFTAYLDGSPMALDRGEQDVAVYRTPFRAALARTTGTRSTIVRQVVVVGDGPVEAALAAGIPEDVAKLTAEAVLRWFWRSMSSGPLPRPSVTA